MFWTKEYQTSPHLEYAKNLHTNFCFFGQNSKNNLSFDFEFIKIINYFTTFYHNFNVTNCIMVYYLHINLYFYINHTLSRQLWRKEVGKNFFFLWFLTLECNVFIKSTPGWYTAGHVIIPIERESECVCVFSGERGRKRDSVQSSGSPHVAYHLIVYSLNPKCI